MIADPKHCALVQKLAEEYEIALDRQGKVRKCYWGAWDSQSQRQFDIEGRARKLLEKVLPGAWCTYFPGDEYYQVWFNRKPICGWDRKFQSHGEAIFAALALTCQDKPVEQTQ